MMLDCLMFGLEKDMVVIVLAASTNPHILFGRLRQYTEINGMNSAEELK